MESLALQIKLSKETIDCDIVTFVRPSNSWRLSIRNDAKFLRNINVLRTGYYVINYANCANFSWAILHVWWFPRNKSCWMDEFFWNFLWMFSTKNCFKEYENRLVTMLVKECWCLVYFVKLVLYNFLWIKQWDVIWG